MALSFHLVGPDAEGVSQFFSSALHPVRSSRTEQAAGAHLLDLELRVGPEEGFDTALIFLRGEGAGGIDETAAAFQHSGSVVKDFLLPGGAQFYIVGAPLGSGSLVFAEHALPGAGGVHHNLVKEFREILRQAAGILVDHHRVGHAHPLHILGQDFGSGGVDFIA